MTIIRKILDTGFRIIDRGRPLAKLRPVLSAVDELFFGTDKVNSVPHISDYIDLKRYMTFVILGLVPAVAGAVYFWGLRVLLVIGVSYAFGGLIEVAFAIARKKEIHEGFLVTGLIFPLVLPPSIPLWAVALGSMFGVTFGKEVFGGTGRNIFNPAIVGRIFLSVCFPGIMTTTWPVPYSGGLGGFLRYGVDSLTLATPLTAFRSEHSLLPWVDLLWGQGGGCIGETFRLGIIIGGVFLLVTRISNWRIPLAYLGTILLFSCIGNGLAPERFAPPLFQLLSGGLLLGALFMATDPVTCPFTRGGKWIGGILLGVLTLLIRSISGYVEGVMFSILMINALSPLIDHIVLAIRYRR
ncbi:MAG: RnfABCDGE type electron transport complex subunit D [Candidatus Omnitrophota bacterium]